tara:strand:+ start:2343 stop:2756 length:414 start_codon:yes stop_codon:yes gene_type:complete
MDFPKLTLENVIIVLLVAFIVIDVKIPDNVSKVVNTLPGNAVVVLLALGLLYCCPILGVVACVAAFVLIRRVGGVFSGVAKYIPSEEKKSDEFDNMNDFPVTLEEEMVAKMVPMSNESLPTAQYQPVLEDLHESSEL